MAALQPSDFVRLYVIFMQHKSGYKQILYTFNTTKKTTLKVTV